MTDHFEKAKDEILKSARANGGITITHLFDALVATNEDLDEKLEAQRLEAVEKHSETKAWHESVKTMVEEHIEEANERDRRITDLELAEKDRRLQCVPMVQKIAKELHDQTHADYVASLGDSQFQNKLVWFFASNLGKVVLVVLGVLAGILLNLAVYGRP